MSKVRYVCERQGSAYYHDKILKQIADPTAIANLGDIALFATYLNDTVSEFNNNPQKLYNHFNDFEMKIEIATSLLHLESIKYLWGNNTATFYEQKL